jgi:TonB family protein
MLARTALAFLLVSLLAPGAFPDPKPASAGEATTADSSPRITPAILAQPRITSGDVARAFRFPNEAARQGIREGTAIVEFDLLPDGSVENPIVIEETPSGAGFGESCLNGISSLRFEPALIDGEPVMVRARYRVRYRMGP